MPFEQGPGGLSDEPGHVDGVLGGGDERHQEWGRAEDIADRPDLQDENPPALG
jgi:hypothetical protein